MTKRYLPLLLAWAGLGFPALAQNSFNNLTHLAGSSDNAGRSANQPGTEVLASTPGLGVGFDAKGSFEHVGQFFVAKDGLWQADNGLGYELAGTDYFGYAPGPAGSYLPYQGRGIQGASALNGGSGAGRPVFGHLHLNSTGSFPLAGGMFVTHSLSFNQNGPGSPNIITTPNSVGVTSLANVVEFAPTAQVKGADASNYIDGFASVSGENVSFTLPLGDPAGLTDAYRPLTVDHLPAGQLIARYTHAVQHSTVALGKGISSVAPIGNWIINAPVGTKVSVSLPRLSLEPHERANLRLVGWDGQQWIDLSGGVSASGCVTSGCSLTGRITTAVTALAIGSTSQVLSKVTHDEAATLTLWPNPTAGFLNIHLSQGKPPGAVLVYDQQGRLVLPAQQAISTLDAKSLPAGSYILEVETTPGHSLRKHFVKQP